MAYRLPAPMPAPPPRRSGRLALVAWSTLLLILASPVACFVALIAGCFDNADEAHEFCADAPPRGSFADVDALKARARELGIDFGYETGPARDETRVHGHGSAFMTQVHCTIRIVHGRVAEVNLHVWE